MSSLGKGVHPNSKKQAKAAIAAYTKALKKFSKDCAIDSVWMTPMSTVFSEAGKSGIRTTLGR